MPFVTGNVNDGVRKKSYLVHIFGPDATEVFFFNNRSTYNSMDPGLKLESVPTIMMTSNTGNMEDAKKGKYIYSDINIHDVPCDDGDYKCPITGVTFAKQAILIPYDNHTQTVNNVLRNGELLMTPIHPKSKKTSAFQYPINLIEVGSVLDLETPVGLANLRTRMFNARASVQAAGQDEAHFRPITGDSPEQGQHDDSATSATSTASTIITGTLNLGRATPANRISCGVNVERQLDRAVSSSLDPDFTPWMASTGATPPSSRPHSAQSLPAELGSPEDTTSPTRPKSASPTKRGRPAARKSSRDRTWQPSIRNFLAPSPTSPIRSRTPLPLKRNKRRSQRPADEGTEGQPPSKRRQSGEEADDLNKTQGTSSNSSMSEDSVQLIEEIPLDPPRTVDVESNQTIPITDLAPQTSTDMDTSNEAASKGPDYTATPPTPPRPSPQSGLQSVPTPPISTSSSRATSLTTNMSDAEFQVTRDPYENPTPGPSRVSVGHNVSLHTNVPLDNEPKHMLIKAYKDHVQVKILTFKAYNLEDIVRCFFDEEYECDNPGSSIDSSVETINDISNDKTSPNTTFVSRMSKFLSSTMEVFTKRPTPNTTDDASMDVSKEDEIVINTAPQEEEEKGEDQEEEGRDNAS